MAITRRNLLSGLAVTSAAALVSKPVLALSGAINANSQGLRSGSSDDQGAILQGILENASVDRKPVFIEPGHYRVSNVTLPQFTHLEGVAGATKLSYGGGNHFLLADRATHIALSGLELDGALRPTAEYADAALHLSYVETLTVTDCRITNASGSGAHIIGSAGRFANNRIDSVVGPAGFMGHNNTGLHIASNLIEECANGGILVHRWDRGSDDTIVTHNRVRRISAIYGGTGQWGNGINTYLADGVMIADNHVSDCAFSTIRSNSCSNIQINDNTCLRAGETSVYSEFAFQGAIISGNIIDGAATGISLANFNEGGRMSVCANNLVRNLYNRIPYKADGHIHGNGIYAEADTVVGGNVVENAENFGVMLGWGPYLRNVQANGNIIRKAKSGFYVSVVEGIGSVAITDNIMSDLSSHAIAGYRWQDAVTGDLLSPGSKQYSALDIQGNKVDS